MQWYYAPNGQRKGPASVAELTEAVQNGIIQADTLVWRNGMADWQPYGQVAATEGLPPAGAPDDETAVCAVSGQRHPKRSMVQYEGRWISAEHRDTYFQRLREGVALPSESVVPGPFGYGGFWRRFLARFVDGLLVGVVNMVFAGMIGFWFGATGRMEDPANAVMMQVVVQLIGLALGISYELFFIRKYDATPGKMALGLKLLRADGGKLSKGRIIGRYFSHIVSGIIFAIGYIMAAFDEEKRALHDRMCDTRVIKTRT